MKVEVPRISVESTHGVRRWGRRRGFAVRTFLGRSRGSGFRHTRSGTGCSPAGIGKNVSSACRNRRFVVAQNVMFIQSSRDVPVRVRCYRLKAMQVIKVSRPSSLRKENESRIETISYCSFLSSIQVSSPDFLDVRETFSYNAMALISLFYAYFSESH